MNDSFLILLLFIGVGYFIWFATVGAGRSLGKKKMCPYCRKYGMKAKGGGYYRNGKRVSDWECPHCGERFTN